MARKAAALGLAWATLSACLAFDPQVFLPISTDAYTLPDNRIPRAHLAEVSIPSTDRVTLAAWIATQPDALASPTVLYLHGQAGHIDDYWDWVNGLWEAGYNVLIVDYRGYGKSTGAPDEQGLYDDALASLEWLRARAAIDPDRILTWGFSLGTAVASWLAVTSPTEGLVLEAPFTSITEMIERSGPYELPADWLSDVRFDTLGRIASLRVPLVLAHGTDDRRIPPWMGREVFDAAPEPKLFISAEGASHSNVFERESQAMLDAVAEIMPTLAP